MAVASPPPMQRLAIPRLPPVRSRAAMRVAMMRAPLAPIGWPMAVAPPWMLTLSCGMPRSFIANMVTQAKASLISNRSTSAIFQPVFSSRRSIAPMGAVVNWAGSRAWAVWATTGGVAGAGGGASGGWCSVDGGLVGWGAEGLRRGHGGAGEGLVDLEQVDIGGLSAGLVEQALGRADGGGGELGRRAGVGSVGDDAGDGFEALGLGGGGAGHDQGGGAVGDGAGVGGGEGAVLRESGAEARDFGSVALQRLLVLVDRLGARAGLRLDGYG